MSEINLFSFDSTNMLSFKAKNEQDRKGKTTIYSKYSNYKN